MLFNKLSIIIFSSLYQLAFKKFCIIVPEMCSHYFPKHSQSVAAPSEARV